MEKNNKTLNVPNLRFPEFCGEWERETLQSVATLLKGTGISKDQLSEEGQSCILYGELYTKYRSEIIDTIISKTDIDPKRLVRSQTNDVIIPCSGESAVDIATARCVKQSDVLLGGDLNIIRLKGEHDGSFFAYQLNGKRKYDIAKVAQGVSVVHLYGEHLKGVKVNYPSAAEQKKISSLLALIDQRIETQKKVIEKYESLIRGLCEKLTRQGTANKAINECLECHTSTLQESNVSDTGEYPVYGATGICGYTDSYDISDDGILIIKDGASVGMTYYASSCYSHIGTLNRLTAKKGIDLRYIYYCLKVMNFAPYKTGLAIPHIYFKDYGKHKIWCPSYEQQLEISNLLKQIDDKIQVEKSLLEQLNSQKRYILNRLFI